MTIMRVSFILSSLWLSGGTHHVIQLANRLSQRGYDVYVVTPKGASDQEILDTIQKDVKIISSNMALKRKMSKIDLLLLAFSLAKAIPFSDVLVATHTPTIVPTLFASLLFRRGKATWFHMDYEEQFEGRPIERWLLKNAPGWFRVILTNSRPQAQKIKKRANQRIIPVGSGLRLEIDRNLPSRSYNLNPPFKLLYIGDPRPRKGFADALSAVEIVAERLPVIFTVVSKMPISFKTDVPHQIFIRPSDKELIDIYRSNDLLVFSSWQEGLGYPPLEAMACGTPVVATRCSGILDYACHEENCLLVPPRRPKLLARAILRLLNDTRLYLRLVRGGLLTSGGYTWEKALNRLEKGLFLVMNS